MNSLFPVLLSKGFSERASASRGDSGQSLIETALTIPFLLLIALNAINFGYFFFTAINLAAAPRDAVEFSVQGFQTPGQLTMPAAGPPGCNQASASTDATVSDVTYDNVTKVLSANGASRPCPNMALVRVCTSSGTLGVSFPGTTSQATNCRQDGVAPSGAPALGTTAPADPEAPNFLLNQVDIIYQVKPLIPGNVFGITLLPTYTFHRKVSMRQLN